VSDGEIDVVSGNSGPPIDAQGDVDKVWESGYFDPSTSTDGPYSIIGYIAPVGPSGVTPAVAHDAPSARTVSAAQQSAEIATQDGGH